MPKFLVGLALLFLSTLVQAQTDVVFLYGNVKDNSTGLKLQGAKVSVLEDGKPFTDYVTPLNGRFEIELNYDHDYEVAYSKDGYVTKRIRIDSRNVPKDKKIGGQGFDYDILLFETVEGVNFDLLKQPIGIAKYIESAGKIDFDIEYTKAFLAKLAELERSYQNKAKQDADRLKAEQLAAEKEKQKQLKFEQAVKDGDAAMTAGNFTNAIFKFNEALEIKPATKYVEEKLAAAKKAQDDANTLKQKEQMYKEAIAAADKAYVEKNYKGAIAEYNKALNHKPTENYPKTRIKEAEDQLATIAKQTAADNQYKTAIAKADSTFKLNKFEQSITFYEAALAVKAGEAYPQQKIGEAKLKIDEIAKQKALDDRYKNAIAAGDKAMTEKRYQDAIAGYQEAAGIKTAEQYPKTKIAEAQGKLDAIAKAKDLDDQYKGVIADADKQLAAADYKGAIETYNKAAALKPTEVYPKTKITEANAKLAEIAKKEAADKQYVDLITKGDQQLAAKDFTTAVSTYTQASGIKPTEQYPKDKIAEAKKGLDELAKLKDIDTRYKAAIVKADLAYNTKKFQDALVAYTEAKNLKPGEEYPAMRVIDTQNQLDALAKLRAQDKEFKDLAAIGDSLFKTAKYTEAITYYERAQKVKPEDIYPKNRITEANAKLDALGKQKALDEQYAGLITNADNLFKDNKFTEALEEYKKASALKLAEVYPKNRITETQNKLAAIAKQDAADKQYADLIKKGDDQLAAKDWSGALASYQQASGVKPTEVYPKDKAALAKTELDKIAQQKALDTQYAGIVSKADAAFTAKQFDVAIKGYQQASGLKPDEVYPKDKIKEAEGILADLASQKETDKRYNGYIVKADSAFKAAKYESAIDLYSQASDIKPAEAYPKNRIAEANTKMDELSKKLALDEKYKGLITKADGEFGAASYETAITTYKEASALKPTELYPKNKITEANTKLAEIAKNKAKDEQYATLIKEGDSFLGASDYTSSITKFQAALTLKPTEQYPKDKLAEARAKLDEINKQKAADDQYKGIIAKADISFAASKWQESIGLYEQALKIKANEEYPTGRIKEAQSKLADLAKQKQEQDDAFKKAVALGDEAFTAADYASAKVAYQQALGIKPNEAYPKQKITEADAKLAAIAKQDALNKQYAGLIEKADASFKDEEFAAAIPVYQQASVLKPTEKYPKDQIADANAKIAELKKQQGIETQYRTLITKADADFNALSFEAALKGYEQASALKAEEVYPKDRIETTKIRLAELNAAKLKEQNYKAAIAKGDAAFTAKDYTASIKGYEEALDIKEGELYPQERIKMANAELFKISKAKETDDKYKGILVVADTAFGQQKWAESITSYKEALTVKPGESYPTGKIKEAEAKIAEIEKAKQIREAKYVGLINKADSAFTKQSYQVAKNYYSEAIRVKPNEQYPKDRLEAADAKLDEEAKADAEAKAQKELQQLNAPVVEEKKDPTIVQFQDAAKFNKVKIDTTSKPVIPAATNQPKVMYRTTVDSNLDEFRRTLGANYPEGKTEEQFQEGNKKIYRTIFVKDKMGDEYLKVIYTGVGTFYFKNGDTSGLNSLEFEKLIKEL